MNACGSAPEALDRTPTPEEQQAAAAHVLRAGKEAARSRRIPEGVAGAKVESAGIIGFGTMGRGIAMSFAAAGIPVTVFEESDDAWKRGEAAVAGSLSRAVSRGKIEPPEAERRMERIRRATGFDDLNGADFFVEAVFEEMGVKRDVFAPPRQDREAGSGACDEHLFPRRECHRRRHPEAGRRWWGRISSARRTSCGSWK